MQSEDIEYSTGAQAALAGYRYQLKVSVLFALDVLAKRQEADQITLEPANREDLETELKDEPGALTQRLTIKDPKTGRSVQIAEYRPLEDRRDRVASCSWKKTNAAKGSVEGSRCQLPARNLRRPERRRAKASRGRPDAMAKAWADAFQTVEGLVEGCGRSGRRLVQPRSGTDRASHQGPADRMVSRPAKQD